MDIDYIKYMKIAYQEAKKAYALDEVPIGCCIVQNGKVIAKGHNERENKQSVTRHAEMIAIEKACKKLNRWILDDCAIYITVEPCLMCAGAISQARIKTIIYGVNSPKYGCVESIMRVFDNTRLCHNVNIINGILKDEIEELLKNYFKELRKR